MFEKISMKLSQMITSTDADSDETDVIRYGLECIINTLIPIIIYTIYSAINHQINDMIVWLIFFLGLRNYIGGYHAPTQLSCIVISTLFGIFSLYIDLCLSVSFIFYKIALMIIMMMIFIVVGPIMQYPSDSLKKRLSLFAVSFQVFGIIIFTMLLHLKVRLGNAIFIGMISAYLLYLLHLLLKRLSLIQKLSR